MKSKPLVSICCAVYNHEDYIKETLDSFLRQECDFEYEILIHDDASTDKTTDIIKEYTKLYPNKIFPIYQKENQYSQGKKYSDLNYERVKGKYVAICEGDDCWIDKKKLSKQIRLMEENSTYSFCFHPAIHQNMESNKIKIIGDYLDSNGIVTIEDIIMKSGGMVPTASCLITKEVLEKVLEFKSTRPYLSIGDIYIQIFGSLETGGALYINDIMSLYRYLTPQSWSTNWLSSSKLLIKHIISMAKSFYELNRITNYKYEEAFEESTIKRVFHLISTLNRELDEHRKLDLTLLPPFAIVYISEYLEILKSFNKTDETYILYGAGTTAKLIIEVLGNKIDFILDGDIKKNNTLFYGKKVFHLDYLNPSHNQKIIISLIGRYHHIIPILKVDKSRVVFFDKELAKKSILRNINFNI